jgi:sugar phosphate isomerase/epimerase
MKHSKYTRTHFFKLLGMGTAALTFPNLSILASPVYKPRIGIQLYTVRNEILKKFEETIRKITEIGYSGIETYSLPENITLENAAKIFRDYNLKIFSMHSDLPVGEKRDLVLRMADIYDCDTVIYPGWPEGEKFEDLEQTKRTVESYNEISEFLKAKGLKFGLHNHWWEFEKTSFGIYPFYYLLENLNKDIVFEIDTYWTKTAGLDPAEVIKDFGDRAPLLHIKDGPAVKGDGMYKHVPAGEGTLNFKSIVIAGGENIEWMIVEFDEYEKNIFDGIKSSYDYLIKNNLASGKSE